MVLLGVPRDRLERALYYFNRGLDDDVGRILKECLSYDVLDERSHALFLEESQRSFTALLSRLPVDLQTILQQQDETLKRITALEDEISSSSCSNDLTPDFLEAKLAQFDEHVRRMHHSISDRIGNMSERTIVRNCYDVDAISKRIVALQSRFDCYQQEVSQRLVHFDDLVTKVVHATPSSFRCHYCHSVWHKWKDCRSLETTIERHRNWRKRPWIDNMVKDSSVQFARHTH